MVLKWKALILDHITTVRLAQLDKRRSAEQEDKDSKHWSVQHSGLKITEGKVLRLQWYLQTVRRLESFWITTINAINSVARLGTHTLFVKCRGLRPRCCGRLPNRVLQSRPKISCNPVISRVISRILTRAHTFNPELPGFCFKIPNPELQIREIPDSEKPTGDRLVIRLTLKITLTSFINDYKINNCKLHQKQAKLILHFCFTLSLRGVIKRDTGCVICGVF